MKIVVGGTKGGSGKSTVSTNLAVLRATEGHEVLLVDADDQETAADFTELRNQTLEEGAGYTCIKLTGPSVRTEVQRLAPKYDDIIIDTGGRDTTSQRAALTVADILLVPFVPRSFDVWTLDNISRIVDEMKVANPDLKAFIFLNRADPAGKDNQAAQEYILEELEDQGRLGTFELLDASLGTRKAFGNAQSKGLAVTEHCPKNLKAEHEMLTLYSYIFNVMVKSNLMELQA